MSKRAYRLPLSFVLNYLRLLPCLLIPMFAGPRLAAAGTDSHTVAAHAAHSTSLATRAIQLAADAPTAWTQAGSAAPWAPRWSHASVVFNDRIWILGGNDKNHIYHDVWSSSDGANWTTITTAAAWPARYNHSVVVFDNKLYLLGGYDGSSARADVWSSLDGLTWTRLTNAAPWGPRYGMSALVLNHKIWVIGGYTTGATHDVWSSPDGITWTQETSAAPWLARAWHRSEVLGGVMWIMGGYNGGSFLNDVWSSADGVTWTEVTANAPWAPRNQMGSSVAGGKLWVVGGYGNSQYFADAWSSSDGAVWTKSAVAVPWGARNALHAATFFNRLYILGGNNYTQSTSYTDSWYLPVAAEPQGLSVTPFSGLSAAGRQGGPFAPDQTIYTLTNESAQDLAWTAAPTQSWVTLSKAGGSLAAGASETVTVSINSAAALLAGGVHLGAVSFTNATSGAGNSTRPVNLAVQDANRWKLAANAAPWGARSPVEALAFDQKLWVMGGYDQNGYESSDVWSSSDGVTWTQVTSDTYWGRRVGQKLAVFNGKLFLLGGRGGPPYYFDRSDVWSSSNGLYWDCATSSAPWGSRTNMGVVAFNGKLWLLGGIHNSNPSNDVWSSSDGATWTRVTAAAPWAVRSGLRVEVLGGRMMVIGGANGSGPLNDVWSSNDGVNWQPETACAPWPPRGYMASAVIGDKIWILGGQANDKYYNDAWYSTDGAHWTQSTAVALWGARSSHAAVALNGQLYVLGGSKIGTTYADIWRLSVVDAPKGLDITPDAYLASSGGPGGPFAPDSFTYTLTNESASPLDWTAAKSQAWSTLSKTGGSLAPGASDTVTVSISANANSLAAGAYSDTVTFTDVTTGLGTAARTTTLNIVAPKLSISPATTFSAAGYGGGPFQPALTTYTLTNTGGGTLPWAATQVPNWVSVSPTSGTLAAGESTRVTVSFSTAANALDFGFYNDTVTFTNKANSNNNATGNISLTVNDPVGWELGTNAAPWSARISQASVAFGNKLWILGGYYSGYLNDIWSSSDGVNWTRETAAAPWSARSGHQVVVFKNKLYLLGGNNSSYLSDVWSSSDGVNWTQLTAAAPWNPRSSMAVVTFDNKLWVMGGYNNYLSTYHNDVWSSPDGITWTRATPAAPWATRSGLCAEVFGGRMWIMGGGSMPYLAFTAYNDVWSSTNGVNWTRATAGAPWSTRASAASAVIGGKLWILGGYYNSGAYSYYNNEAWFTSDGVKWTKSMAIVPWAARAFLRSAVLQNRLYIMGGKGASSGSFNDVWYLPVAPLNYPVLDVTPNSPLSASGLAGGPFTPDSASYTLANTTTGTLAWTAAKKASWVTLSKSGGSLAAGTTATVTVSLNSGANALAVGSYADQVAFTNTNNGLGNTTRTISLEVVAPVLRVTPPAGLTASGRVGGPFTPSSAYYVLTNTGKGTMNWTAGKTANWVTLNKTGGSLAAGASTSVFVSLNSDANALKAQSYSDTVTFTNTNTGQGNTTRNVSLTVIALPALQVTPATNLSVSGYLGGPFAPAATTYTLTNTSQKPLAWTAVNSASWVSLSKSSGNLAAGTSQTVAVSLNSRASGQAMGSHGGTVAFINTANGDGNATRTVSLTISDPYVWRQATSAAPWRDRVCPTTVVFNNKLWLMAGESYASTLSDVWSSSDGVNWTQANAAAPWGGRYGAQAVVFNNKLYLLGGHSLGYGSRYFNDVWSSSDGVNWTQVTSWAPWKGRTHMGVLAFNGKLWVMGGTGDFSPNPGELYTYFNDVWNSTDGVTWTRVTDAAPWAERCGFSAKVFGGKMWVIGGVDASDCFNDVWNSTDGVNWTQVAAGAPWAARTGFGSAVGDGKLWILGGGDLSSCKEVWYTADGVTWTQSAVTVPWCARSGLAAEFFQNRLYMMAGYADSPTLYLHDVWYLPVTMASFPALEVTPATGLNASGYLGGPFSPLSIIYSLKNNGTGAMHWTVARTPNWVSLSRTGGTLAAGATDTVTVSLNSNANVLAPNTYTGTVAFTNTSNGAGNTTSTLTLKVLGRPVLSVTPATGLSASGRVGGPFSPASTNYTLKNTGTAAMSWTAARSASWATLSKTNGSLLPGASDTVTVSISAGATALPAQAYSGTVTFTNATNGRGNTTRAVNLTVVPMLDASGWVRVQAASAFSARQAHACAVFNGKLWVIGGYDGNKNLNDAWSSADGKNWTRVTAAAAFPARQHHTCLVFNNKLWVIGGYNGSACLNDVWSSADGAAWTRATSAAAFTKRMAHSSVVFGGKMWVIGGFDGGKCLGDAWASNDGVNWNRATATAFPARAHHASAVFNNRLWVVGGSNASGNRMGDVWSSANGANWILNTNQGATPRDDHACTVLGGKVWLTAGSAPGLTREIWATDDGYTWTQQGYPATFPARDDHASLVFGGKLWVIGGLGVGSQRLNDVWSYSLGAAAQPDAWKHYQ